MTEKISGNQPILVTGAHRSGTTWVGKMLSASGEAAYIREPLNVLHRPGVLNTTVRHWYLYICDQNESEFIEPLRQTLNFHYHLWAEIKSLRSIKDALRLVRDAGIFLSGRMGDKRPLLKDPLAVFSTPWFAKRLDCRVVISVRHPAAFVSSLKRLDWPFDFINWLDQPLLMQHWLEPFRKEMVSYAGPDGDIIGRSSLVWRIIYQFVLQLKDQNPELILVRHEDLSNNPVTRFRDLYDTLGLSFTSRARNSITNSSSSENPKEVRKDDIYGTRLDSRANLKNWKHRLGENEIERIRSLTYDVASKFYSDDSWE